MEDTDNFEPDSSGTLMDLKYQGLSVVDLHILSYTTLVYLDVSFNLLESLPDEIYLLQNLEELHCCSNKIAALPESIGSIPSLRLIKANNNMLISLPKSIGQLQSLKSLVLSDNILTSLPDEIGNCNLESLLLENNSLCRLPLSLALLKGKLTQLDVTRNDEQMQTTLPIQIHQDAQSILWILALQREKTHCIETLKTDVKLLQHQIHFSSEALAEAKQQIAELEQKKKSLEDDFESIRYFLTVRYLCRELRWKALELWQSVRRACAKKYSERQAKISAQVDAV
eukprot:scaffold6742_cov164-Skeletonema_marinoi.AAC.5